MDKENKTYSMSIQVSEDELEKLNLLLNLRYILYTANLLEEQPY